MKKLFIDDIRIPNNGDFILLKSSAETIEWLTINGCPDYISFDHDLGGDDTTRIIINWIINRDLDSNGKWLKDNFSFDVHSANPVGVEWINGTMSDYIKFKKGNYHNE